MIRRDIDLPDQKNSENPWPGLAAYTEKEQQLFHGRSRETRELYQRVKREVLTIIFGSSGVGKSSLLHAGLLPKLRTDHFFPVLLRIDYSGTTAPRLQIQAAIQTAALAHGLEVDAICPPMTAASEESLWEQLHRLEFWDSRTRLLTPVLIFDQFEEIFTLGGNSKDAASLLRELTDLVENHIPERLRSHLSRNNLKLDFPFQQQDYKVVITVREDFAAHFDQLCQQLVSGLHNRFYLTGMNGKQAYSAVVKPGQGIISEETAVQVVCFVAAAREGEQALADLAVEPALLSVVCRELNQLRINAGKPTITSSMLSGNREAILEDFYEQSIQDLGAEVPLLIEEELLTGSGFRDSMAVEDALQRYGITEKTLKKLENRRLLRREERLHVIRIELVHDLLTGVILKSRDKRHTREQREQERQLLRKQRMQRTIVAGRMTVALVVLALSALLFLNHRKNAKIEQMHRMTLVQKEIVERERERATVQLARATYNFGLALLTKAEMALQEKDINAAVLYGLHSLYHFADKNVLDNIVEDNDVIGKTLKIIAANPSYPVLFRTPWIEQHTGPVSGVAFSADGKMVASSGSKDRTVIVWDRVTGEQKYKLSSHSRANSVAFSPDNTLLALGTGDSSVIIWDMATGKEKMKLSGHTDTVYTIAFSPDGLTLASGSGDASIILWNMATGKKKMTLRGHSDTVYSIAFSPDGTALASGSGDNSVILWDLANGTERKKFQEHTGSVLSVAFSPDSARLVSGSRDSSVIVRELLADRSPRILREHTGSVYGVAFSPDGTYLASGSWDRSIVIRDPATGKMITRKHGHDSPVRSIAFSPDSSILAAGLHDNTLYVLDLATGKELSKNRGHAGVVTGVAFSPDGASLASGSTDNSIIIWDTATGRERGKLVGHTGDVLSLAYSPDGTRLASGSADKSVIIWDLATGKGVKKIREAGKVPSVVFSPDGTTLAFSVRSSSYYSNGYNIILWDLIAEKVKARLEHVSKTNDWYGYQWSDDYFNIERVATLDFSPDGSLLASGSEKGIIVLWDAGTGKEKTFFSGHGDRVTSLDFSPDNTLLASGSADGSVLLWDVPAGKKRAGLRGNDGEIMSVTFSADGQLLAAGSWNRDVILWDAATGKIQAKLWGHGGSVRSIAFSPDDRILASGSGDHSIIFWDVAGDEKIQGLTSLGESIDNRRLEEIISSYEQQVRLKLQSWKLVSLLTSNRADNLYTPLPVPAPVQKNISDKPDILPATP
jgi:WD40 repeat protein